MLVVNNKTIIKERGGMKEKIVFLILCASFMGMLLITGGVFPYTAHASDDVLIVCNKSVPEDSLAKNDIRDIFLGKKSMWSDGSKVELVMLDDANVTRVILKELVRKTTSQFRTYWKKKVFTGRGKAPRSFETTDALVEYIISTDGAIGYIPKSANNSQLKTITVK